VDLVVSLVALAKEQWIKCILLGALSLPLGGLMRLIPVRDRTSDLATLTPLMEQAQVAAKGARRLQLSESHTAAASTTSVLPFSFLVWLFVVSAIPVLVIQHFGEHFEFITSALPK
jgi:hypothetical protein